MQGCFWRNYKTSTIISFSFGSKQSCTTAMAKKDKKKKEYVELTVTKSSPTATSKKASACTCIEFLPYG